MRWQKRQERYFEKRKHARTLAIFPNALILERLEKFTKPATRRAKIGAKK